MKKQPVKKTAVKTTEKRDQYTVVLEDLRSNFRAFGENLDSVRDTVEKMEVTLDLHTQKLDSHSQILDSHTKKLDLHSQILESHTKKLDSHSQILESHTKKLDSHSQMIARVMEDVEEIKSGMREKVDRSEFVKLEKRLVVLETMVLGGKKRGK